MNWQPLKPKQTLDNMKQTPSMDPNLFKAAIEGKVDVLKQYKDELYLQLTPNKNTVLHVAAQFGRALFVLEVLKMHPSMSREVNLSDETPLHLASKQGHSGVVEFLINSAKEQNVEIESGLGPGAELIRMTNKERDTALHEAVRSNHVRVAKLLVEADRDYSYFANKSGESPLYLAAERGSLDLVVLILDSCLSPSHEGPNGRTALHASVISNNKDMTMKIMDAKPALIKETDQDGLTPLHHAALFDHSWIAAELVACDASVAYLANNDSKTALHIAASRGNTDTIKVLIAQCPDCYEQVDSRGRNILHIAVESNKDGVVRLVLETPLLSNLINKTDNDGNTPLHLLASFGCQIIHLITDSRVDKMAYNKENMTALDIISCTERFSALKSLVKRELRLAGATRGQRNVLRIDDGEKGDTAHEHIKKVGETHLIVAALIATVTFAAGFTLPGGYNNDGPELGMAVLTKRAAFKAFVISDTVALVLSTAAVFIYFIAALYANQTKLFNRVIWAFCLTIFAMGAMVVAFMTGIYAVLSDSCSLAVSSGAIGCCFFIAYFEVLRKLYLDKIAKRSRL
ncbi:PGG domain [Dillenia turbinata]|uniref:PGG domain n=1 Tax=Dillenia turbinata TaxID=194707 RepID=A0AAN8YX40_9MAGN